MRYLIFTASAGNGHNTAAKLLKNKILKEDPTSEIKIVDVYREYCGDKLISWIMEKGYAFACNHLVGIYNASFKRYEKLDFENRHKSRVHKDARYIMCDMLREIYDYKPDVIIGTYIYTVAALTDLRRVYDIPAKIIGLTLDYGVSPYWECATGVDYMFLTDEYMRKPFLDRGFTNKQLVISGIPVDEKFYDVIDKDKARKQLKLDKNLFTIIIMKSGFFSIKNPTIIRQLKKINKKVQIVIINGKSENSKKDLDRRIARAKFNHKIINLGFVNNIDVYFSAADLVIGKAGGLTTTETITKGLPSLIISKLPQQEIYNKQYLIDNGCALSIDRKNSISKQVNLLLKDKELYNSLVENSIKIRKLNVVDKFWEIFKTFKPVDYSIIKVDIEKNRKIKASVKKALKEN